MKIVVLIGLLAGACLSAGGCATPAYSAPERDALIARTWNVEAHQITDDFDSILMLRPPGRMSIWNIR
jgi:hypothetical protein